MEIVQFRAEIREWIERNQLPELAGLVEKDPQAERGLFQGVWTGTSQVLADAFAEWDRRALSGRIVCAQWPREFGGRGATSLELLVLQEELDRANMPRPTRGIGEWLVAPSILAFGTSEQKRVFLEGMRSGGDRYCQGFSEPGAGSDLASVRTRGVVDGDEIVVHGHKVWTSLGSLSNRIFVLCRTSAPLNSRHEGLTFVLLDLQDNRITLQPIHQMSGLSTFTEEFFDGARAPLFNVIGGIGNGWRVAMASLTSERGDNAATQHLGLERDFWAVVAQCRNRAQLDDPRVQQQLVWAFIRTQIVRYGSWRTLGSMMAGEGPGTWPALTQLFTSEYAKEFASIALGFEGMGGLIRPDGPGYAVSPSQLDFLWTRAFTIFAGSSQIQRNIIGERILGLPKEPSMPARRADARHPDVER
jgi:alkylation response protein AidB-like acyl-CoA dehydrogenase